MKKPYTVFLFFLLMCDTIVFAQKDISASVSADKTSILIGEPLQITLQATFSNAHVPSFFKIDSLLHFEILNQSKIDTQTAAGQTILKQVITLTSWDSGAWAIPAFSIPAAKEASTKPLPVNVTFTPIPPDQDYHEVKDIIEVAKPPRKTWYWYVIGAALLVLLVLLLFPKRKKENVPDAIIIKESAYKEALKELDALKGKSAAEENEYFTALIHIFRTYVQQRHGIHSFQQTTGELSLQLQQLQLPYEVLKKLVQTLELSDFVKFAQYKVASGERENAWDEIKRSIIVIEQLKK